jgi:hypothetical protein
MKPISSEEIKRNPALMRANAPPPKRSKTSGDPQSFANVDEWMDEHGSSVSSPTSSLFNFTITNSGATSPNASSPSSPKNGSPTQKLKSRDLFKRSVKSAVQRRGSYVSTANTEGSINLAGVDNPRMPFLTSVYLRDRPPSSTLLAESRSLLRTSQTANVEVC